MSAVRKRTVDLALRGAMAMSDAAMPWVGDRRAARELANNVASVLSVERCDAADCASEFIRHRMLHFGLVCGDVDACSRDMARAWSRMTAGMVLP